MPERQEEPKRHETDPTKICTICKSSHPLPPRDGHWHVDLICAICSALLATDIFKHKDHGRCSGPDTARTRQDRIDPETGQCRNKFNCMEAVKKLSNEEARTAWAASLVPGASTRGEPNVEGKILPEESECNGWDLSHLRP